MFDGIPITRIDERRVIEIPRPQPHVDNKGNLILRDGKPQFNVTADRMDFMMSKQSPIRVAFSERFIINPKHRAKTTELAVFFYLANTTEWSNVNILVSGDNKPILTKAGYGQAIITTHGNRSATRTMKEIAKAVDVSYGTVQKALTFWEDASVMSRIEERRRPAAEAKEQDAGRPVERRRYEFDPQYVWNGHIWIGNSYSSLLQGPMEVVG